MVMLKHITQEDKPHVIGMIKALEPKKEDDTLGETEWRYEEIGCLAEIESIVSSAAVQSPAARGSTQSTSIGKEGAVLEDAATADAAVLPTEEEFIPRVTLPPPPSSPNPRAQPAQQQQQQQQQGARVSTPMRAHGAKAAGVAGGMPLGAKPAAPKDQASYVSIKGTRRIKILSKERHRLGYWTASVELYDDIDAPPLGAQDSLDGSRPVEVGTGVGVDVAGRSARNMQYVVSGLMSEYARLNLRSTPGHLSSFLTRLQHMASTKDASTFSMWVAMQLKTKMKGSPDGRAKCQELLALRSATRRLEEESKLLSDRLAFAQIKVGLKGVATEQPIPGLGADPAPAQPGPGGLQDALGEDSIAGSAGEEAKDVNRK